MESHNGLITGFNDCRQPDRLPGAGPEPERRGRIRRLNGAPTSVGNYNGNKWGPRAGIAWQLRPQDRRSRRLRPLLGPADRSRWTACNARLRQ